MNLLKKANAFNEHFYSVFNKAGNVDIYPDCIPLTASAIDDITLTENEVFRVLKCLAKRKASGTDKIPAMLRFI